MAVEQQFMQRMLSRKKDTANLIFFCGRRVRIGITQAEINPSVAKNSIATKEKSGRLCTLVIHEHHANLSSYFLPFTLLVFSILAHIALGSTFSVHLRIDG
jgi:hypothetical protein